MSEYNKIDCCFDCRTNANCGKSDCALEGCEGDLKIQKLSLIQMQILIIN